MNLPAKENFACCDYTIILQDENSGNKLRLSETREAFFNACLHFKSKALVHAFLELESRKGTQGLSLEILGTTLSTYIDKMYKGGRWTSEAAPLHQARPITIIT